MQQSVISIRRWRSARLPPFALLLFFALPLAAFWRCLTFPFVFDDWGFLWSFQYYDTAALVRQVFGFGGQLFYRPGGQAYLFLLYKAFGLRAWPFHLLAFFIHAANSVVVSAIAAKLADDRLIGLLSGLIYATAVSIHLDTLSWASGIFDLGGAFFFFASMWLFLSGRTFSSAFCFLIGLLFKESVGVLPAILAVLELVWRPGCSWKQVRSVAVRLLPHVMAFVLVFASRIATGWSPAVLPGWHPYVLEFDGAHVLSKAYRYVAWMLQSFVPVGRVNAPYFAVIVAILAVLAIATAALGPAPRRKLFLALCLWMPLTLLPVLCLRNFTYRYYATYALPAFICMALLLLEEALTIAGVRQYRTRVLICVAGLSVLMSVFQANRALSEGLRQRTLSDGTCWLVRRASCVNLVRSALQWYLPRPSDGAAIVLYGVDFYAFERDKGIQIWYNNPTLRVYDLKEVGFDAGRPFVQGPQGAQSEAGAKAQRIYLDPAKLHAFQFVNGSLRPLTLVAGE